MTERISELLNMLRDESNCNVLDCLDEASDLIESLAAELEQVKQERDGLNILLGQAQSMLETRTRERDAAVEDLKKNSYTPCATCGKRIDNKSCTEFGEHMPCDMINIFRCEMYEWRGVKEDWQWILTGRLHSAHCLQLWESQQERLLWLRSITALEISR